MILESEEATIQLPPAEFIRLRADAGRTARDINETALFYAQHMWESIPEESKMGGGREYSKAVARIADQGWMKLGRVPGVPKAAMADVMVMRQGIEDAALLLVNKEVAAGVPTHVTWADVNLIDEAVAEHQLGDCTLYFNEENYTVEWEFPEGDQSVQRGRSHPVFTQLHENLTEVRWTLDTGGLVENDLEFLDDNEEPMRGKGNVAFGPLGAVMDPRSCKPFTLANGAVIGRNELVQLQRLPQEERMSMIQAQIQPYSKPEARFRKDEQPRGHIGKDGKVHGGQFTFKSAGDSSVQL